jgi:hypothetical protein
MTQQMKFTAEQLADLGRRVAAGEASKAIAASLGMNRKTILHAVRKNGLGPWVCKQFVPEQTRRPIPADFAVNAAVMSDYQLARHYGCGASVPARWRKEQPVARPNRSRGGKPKVETPDDFASWAPGKSLREISEHYGFSHDCARRMRVECGILSAAPGFQTANKPAHLVNNAYVSAPLNRPIRDGSRAGIAADYLRKYGAVYRCTPMGAADPKGTHWRRGSAILSDAAIIQRAEYNGWSHDAWKQVRAA